MRSCACNLFAEAWYKLTCKSIGSMNNMADMYHSPGSLNSVGKAFRCIVRGTYRLHRRLRFNRERILEFLEEVFPDRYNKSVRPKGACLIGSSAEDAAVYAEFLRTSTLRGVLLILGGVTNLLCFFGIPYCNLNLRQPFPHLSHLFNRFVKCQLINKNVHSLNFSCLSQLNALIST